MSPWRGRLLRNSAVRTSTTSRGARIRQARLNAGLTLEALANEAGISKALLSKIENSKVSSPLATFSKISKVLGVPLSDLLKEEEQINTWSSGRRTGSRPWPQHAPGFVYERWGPSGRARTGTPS